MNYLVAFLGVLLSVFIIREVILRFFTDREDSYNNCFKENTHEKFTLTLPDNLNTFKKYQLKQQLSKKINAYRKEISFHTGFIIPNVKLEFDKTLDVNQYELYLLKKLVSRGCFYHDKVVIKENDMLNVLDKIPDIACTYIDNYANKCYFFNPKRAKLAKKLKNVKHKDFLDLIVEEINDICSKNLEDIIDLKYIVRFLGKDENTFFACLPYVDAKGDCRYLSINDVRWILITLIKNSCPIVNKDHFVQKLTDCLNKYTHIYYPNIELVIDDLKILLHNEKKELVVEQDIIV